MSSPIDEIKSRLDIVEVINGYIRLQKAGRNYKALCPFHSEKTPSFMVSPERQMWHCFGCGAGGSIFDFVMQIEGVEFADALRILAQRAGVELKKVDPKLKTERTRLYEICDWANRFFIKQLEASQIGKSIQKYLIERGLSLKTIKDWQIGYAPGPPAGGWRALLGFLKSRGYPEDEILKSGLIIEREQEAVGEKYYDRFRDRIIFPIHDLNETVIGFAGRENPYQPDNRMGKYINTPNTLIYDKSRVLYGLDKAKLDIKKKNLCVLVEGQLDVIMSHQAGTKNVVASSGTALTEQQLKVLKRYTENLATAFDTDLAGETATKRGLDLAIQLGFSTKVISLPDNCDPADYLKRDISLWPQVIDKAQGLIEFYLDKAFAKNNPQTVEGKKEISRVLLPVIKKIPNKVEQAHWLQEIAHRLKVQEGVLVEEMNKIKGSLIEGREADWETSPQILKEAANLEEYTLGLVLANLDKFKECKDEPCYLFAKSELKEIFRILKKNKEEQINLKSFQKKLPADLAVLLDYLVFKSEASQGLVDGFEPEKEIKFCFNQLRKRYLHQRLNQLNLAIAEAEEKHDKASLEKLTEEFKKLASQLPPATL